MKIKAMNYLQFKYAIKEELELENIDTVCLIGYKANSKKFKNTYGVLDRYKCNSLTASPGLVKQVRNAVRASKYYIDRNSADSTTYVYIAVNGAKFSKFHKESIIVCKDGSIFHCEADFFYSDMNELVKFNDYQMNHEG